jgi:pimeloyl-[acyl-carrier protein] methyl ester esterase
MHKHIQQVCWIHGWGMTEKVWDGVVTWMPDVHHHYVNFENCVSTEQLHQVIHRVLTKHTGPWMVVGWSMGGMLAIEQLFTQCHDISSVVLVSTTLQFVQQDRSRGWPLRTVERMRKQVLLDPAHVVKQFFQAMHTQQEFISLPLSNEKQVFTHNTMSLDVGLRYLIETDLTDQWSNWKQDSSAYKPCIHWIHGSEDIICPLGAVPSDLAQDELTIIQGAGHALMLTQPHRFAQLLKGWT